MKKTILLLTVLLPAILFAQLAKTVTINSLANLEGGGEKTIDASNYSNWVYFSFETGDVVDVTDPYESDEWDIALLRYNFKTNGGASGNGMAEVFDAGVVSFESVVIAPDDNYVKDDSISIFDHASTSYIKQPGSEVLGGWMTLDMSTMPPGITYNNNIYVIKTAKGKYAKMIVTGYYNDQGASGHITFTYFYQEDGSKNLDQSTGVEDNILIPEFKLSQNYPNPFNPTTNLNYNLPKTAEVTIKIYNVLGSEISTLVDNEIQSSGAHSISWNAVSKTGVQVSSGTYFCKMIANVNGEVFTDMIKMNFVK